MTEPQPRNNAAMLRHALRISRQLSERLGPLGRRRRRSRRPRRQCYRAAVWHWRVRKILVIC